MTEKSDEKISEDILRVLEKEILEPINENLEKIKSLFYTQSNAIELLAHALEGLSLKVKELEDRQCSQTGETSQ